MGESAPGLLASLMPRKRVCFAPRDPNGAPHLKRGAVALPELGRGLGRAHLDLTAPPAAAVTSHASPLAR